MVILLLGDVDHINVIRTNQERGRHYDIGERSYLQDEALEGTRIQACRGQTEGLAPDCHWECSCMARGNAKTSARGPVYRRFQCGEVNVSMFSLMS